MPRLFGQTCNRSHPGCEVAFGVSNPSRRCFEKALLQLNYSARKQFAGLNLVMNRALTEIGDSSGRLKPKGARAEPHHWPQQRSFLAAPVRVLRHHIAPRHRPLDSWRRTAATRQMARPPTRSPNLSLIALRPSKSNKPTANMRPVGSERRHSASGDSIMPR
jgi:hypothetical protein